MKAHSGRGIGDRNGMVNSPDVVMVHSKTHCHYCPEDKMIPKGAPALRLVVNSGPVGLSFICMEHARKLRDELAVMPQLKKGWVPPPEVKAKVLSDMRRDTDTCKGCRWFYSYDSKQYGMNKDVFCGCDKVDHGACTEVGYGRRKVPFVCTKFKVYQEDVEAKIKKATKE